MLGALVQMNASMNRANAIVIEITSTGCRGNQSTRGRIEIAERGVRACDTAMNNFPGLHAGINCYAVGELDGGNSNSAHGAAPSSGG